MCDVSVVEDVTELLLRGGMQMWMQIAAISHRRFYSVSRWLYGYVGETMIT